ncbi:hypothetical protein [Methylosinus sp. PW1]|uniref:hypothetical protein n=1 Tax=Methylosinus sp. PW1 TaxID=107636 RepID=UPI00068E75FA|nr:hypothetical protein [Methylosinus sp. PW1]
MSKTHRYFILEKKTSPKRVNEEVVLDLGPASMQVLSNAERDVLDERRRQITKGYDAEHDDEHVDGEIARAAIARIQRAMGESHYSASPTAREKLVDGVAMLIAEIERLDRAKAEG